MIDNELLASFAPPQGKNSWLISFEGIEGSGKSTQIQALRDLLEKRGLRVEVYREPGGTPFGEKLRDAILNSQEPVSALAEACLFASSRAQLLQTRILPSLERPNTAVIVDRFIDSSLAYQGFARELGMETVLRLHQTAPLNTTPHLSFYLRIDLEESFQRQKQRGSEKDYFEKENARFYAKLIEGYDAAAELFKERFAVLNGKQEREALARQIGERALKLTGV